MKATRTITVSLTVQDAEEALARLEERAKDVERRVQMAITRLERAEAKLAESDAIA